MLVPNLLVLAVLLVPAGMAWLFVLMGVTGALQVFLPGWVRARGLSMFNVVFAGVAGGRVAAVGAGRAVVRAGPDVRRRGRA